MTDREDEPTFLICMPEHFGNVGGFDDNVHGTCTQCGQGVYWRPHAPRDFIRVCIECFHADVVAMGPGEKLRIHATPETRADLARYARTRQAEAEVREKKRTDH